MKTKLYSMFVNNLTEIDCSIWDLIYGLQGKSYSVNIEFIGSLDENSVVFDFSNAKKQTKNIIDELIDHKFVFNESHADKIDRLTPDHFEMKFSNPYTVTYSGPSESFTSLTDTSKSGIESFLRIEVINRLTNTVEGLKDIKLKLIEENNPEDNYFSYTHGLKNHYGNCQRLFHGHKSKVNIFVNGARRLEYEEYICNRLNNKHLIYNDNLYDDEWFDKTVEYTSPQGSFKATIPDTHVLIVPWETTVENISEYILKDIVKTFSLSKCLVEVIAYEGISKGCRFSSYVDYRLQVLNC